jgi:hypothetical protein
VNSPITVAPYTRRKSKGSKGRKKKVGKIKSRDKKDGNKAIPPTQNKDKFSIFLLEKT